MAISNRQFKALIILFLLIYGFILFTCFSGHQRVNYIPLLNTITSASILFYWIRKQLRITQHIYELREMVVLCLEIIFLGISVYTFFINLPIQWLTITGYVISGIHFIVLIVFLIFTLTFKMKKLF